MPLLETDLLGLPKRRGKVRDVYDLGDDRLLIVATDRISAYDWVLPTAIPDKGRVLNSLSAFWFRSLHTPCHLLSTDIDDAGLDLAPSLREELIGRASIVRKAKVVPFECVVRGYLAGSGWREYQSTGSVCGVSLPRGLTEGDRIEPIFTPATKAETGHDENVTVAAMAEAIGEDTADSLRWLSLQAYGKATFHADDVGLILADTKLEWGFDGKTGELLLVDEVFTPDSSRYWPKASYKPGGPQRSYDKQYVRDWLDASGWDKASPPPALPDEVVAKTRDKYIRAYVALTGKTFPWA